ncbi:hypothetical protein LCGC14_1027410 [marine sediment metagenome]|uniref:Uncharacterized protein n=1 Tax=marine sediment metagenome TaxID=412755 RepID=A0A0F9N0A0_9ZZZZ
MSELTYVYDENIEKLEKEVARLNRRAAKLNVPAIQLRIGEVEKVMAGTPEHEHLRAPVSLVGTPPMLAGYTFVGTIDHLSNGLVTSYPGCSIDLKPFRGADATCDHCQVNRQRHETFIIQHEGGAVQRVGRTCLGDFLGHHGNPSALIGHLSLWGKAFEALESSAAAGIGTATNTLELIPFVAFVAQEMRSYGWISKGKAWENHVDATADRAQGAYWAVDFNQKDMPTADDDFRALRAVTWARGLTDSEVEENDYLYNLRAVCQDDFIRPKRGGLAGSVIVAAERAAQAASDPQKSNLHVGTLSEKIELDLKLVDTREHEGYYGTTTLHKFENAAGDLLVWFASNPEFVKAADGSKREMNVGETLRLKGTVKKQGDYRGRLQTTLTRVTHPKPKKTSNKV